MMQNFFGTNKGKIDTKKNQIIFMGQKKIGQRIEKRQIYENS